MNSRLKKNITINYFPLLIILLISFMYMPFMVYPLCALILLIGCKKLSAVVFFYILAVLGISVNVSSFEQFVYHQADFTSYYNNFLTFIDNGFHGDFFAHSGGLEFLLPLVNYIFSLIIDGKYPYLFIIFHNFFQCSLLLVACYFFAKKFKLKIFEFSILLGMVLFFYKYLGMLNHIRQSYASLFILMALFCCNSKWKIVFLIFAFFFHITTIIVYPLLNYIINKNSIKDKVYYICFVLVFGFVLAVFFVDINNYIDSISATNFLIQKIIFGFDYDPYNSNAYFSKLFFHNVKINLYLIILLCFLTIIYFLSSKKNIKLIYLQIACIVLPSLSFFYLASTINRLFSPIIVVGTGFIFFMCFKYVSNHVRSLTFIIFLMLVTKWLLFDPVLYNRFDIVGNKPFYYVPYIFTEKDTVSRFTLPGLENVNYKANRFE